MSGKTITATARGTDVSGGGRDAHIRYEADTDQVFVDVFNSRIRDNRRAYIETGSFDNTRSGAKEASDFLKGYGIRVQISPKR